MYKNIELSASIMCADWLYLNEQIIELEQNDIDYIHYDIVDGIFPGRNTGITKSGNYFDVKSSDSYDLMPDYDLYEPQAAFPSESVLPKTIMNLYKDHLKTKDSIEDTPLSSNQTTTLSRSLGGPQPELGEVSLDDMPRMSRGNMGNPGNGTNNSISKNGLPSTTRSLSPQ